MNGGRERLYTRYSFSADVESVDGAGAGKRGNVTNISYGGCRVTTTEEVCVGASVRFRIQIEKDYFEATARVVHSAGNDSGLMFGDIAPKSLLVLRKWIDAAQTAPSAGSMRGSE